MALTLALKCVSDYDCASYTFIGVSNKKKVKIY